MEELSNNASNEADYDGSNDAHICAPRNPTVLPNGSRHCPMSEHVATLGQDAGQQKCAQTSRLHFDQ
jgi:hypothetical protein